jgi:hypothetical protein
MADIFTLPLSQALRFIDINKSTDVQNYDNRFVKDLVYAKTLPYYFVQQFENTDPLWCQFRTNYTGITANLVDEDNNRTDLTANLELIYIDSSDRSYYNLPVDLSALDGCYFVEFVLSEAGKAEGLFQSEVFTVSDEIEDSTFVEWFGNDQYDDKMHWTDLKQGIRIISSDRNLLTDQNKSVYSNSDYAPISLKSKPIRNMEFVINNAPFWLIEKVNLGLCHDDFYINDLQYNTGEALEVEVLGDLLTKKASIILTQVNFEDGEDNEVTGGIIPFPESHLKINATDDLLINGSGDKLLITG